MLYFLRETTKSVYKASAVDIIYLDFQKTFDEVPQQNILLKLRLRAVGSSTEQ